jgi:hypothetical protein
MYDLIFKYVGTVEASEVGEELSFGWKPCPVLFKKCGALLNSVVRMLPSTRSQEAFKTFSRRTLV